MMSKKNKNNRKPKVMSLFSFAQRVRHTNIRRYYFVTIYYLRHESRKFNQLHMSAFRQNLYKMRGIEGERERDEFAHHPFHFRNEIALRWLRSQTIAVRPFNSELWCWQVVKTWQYNIIKLNDSFRTKVCRRRRLWIVTHLLLLFGSLFDLYVFEMFCTVRRFVSYDL